MSTLHAEIISIGNELLAGHTINSNGAWLAKQLGRLGIPVRHGVTIRDEADEIKESLAKAGERSPIVLCTGGLGPTPDDITKNALCGFFGTELVLDQRTLERVQKIFEGRNLKMPDINQGQAMVPKAALVLDNPIGTAPGLMFNHHGTLYFFMPGVPREMREIFTSQITDQIRDNFALPGLYHRILRTTGVAESKLYEILKPALDKYPEVELSFLPKLIAVDLRLRAGRQEPVDELATEIRKRAGNFVFTETESNLGEVVGKLLTEQEATLAVAESFTGGLISDWLTDVPGCSGYFLGSAVTYSNESKMKLLGVSHETLQEYGAVSDQTVREMALGTRQLYGADYAIASTGIAGPTGATETKPVGMCYLAVAGPNGIMYSRHFRFGNDRRMNKQRGAIAGIELLRRLLLGLPPE